MLVLNHNQVDLQHKLESLQRSLSFNALTQKIRQHLTWYFHRKHVKEKLSKVNIILLKIIFLLDQKALHPNKDFHVATKKALTNLIELKDVLPEHLSSAPEIINLFDENIILTHQLEKKVRIILYDKKKSTNSLMSEAVSGLSRRNIAKALYDNKST